MIVHRKLPAFPRWPDTIFAVRASTSRRCLRPMQPSRSSARRRTISARCCGCAHATSSSSSMVATANGVQRSPGSGAPPRCASEHERATRPRRPTCTTSSRHSRRRAASICARPAGRKPGITSGTELTTGHGVSCTRVHRRSSHVPVRGRPRSRRVDGSLRAREQAREPTPDRLGRGRVPARRGGCARLLRRLLGSPPPRQLAAASIE